MDGRNNNKLQQQQLVLCMEYYSSVWDTSLMYGILVYVFDISLMYGILVLCVWEESESHVTRVQLWQSVLSYV